MAAAARGGDRRQPLFQRPGGGYGPQGGGGAEAQRLDLLSMDLISRGTRRYKGRSVRAACENFRGS